jgi:hypothetical protein
VKLVSVVEILSFYTLEITPSVVIVFATGPKFRGLKPGRGGRIFKGDKIRSTSYLGGAVKPSVPCRTMLRHVKEH